MSRLEILDRYDMFDEYVDNHGMKFKSNDEYESAFRKYEDDMGWVDEEDLPK